MKRRRPEEHAMTGQCCARIVTSSAGIYPGTAQNYCIIQAAPGVPALPVLACYLSAAMKEGQLRAHSCLRSSSID
eukprot:1161565-Pelagomonas_calceolata.AAC.5